MSTTHILSLFFFFNDTATTEIYTLSLHDALPILGVLGQNAPGSQGVASQGTAPPARNAQGWVLHTDAKGNKAYVSPDGDRKSTRLNSSHLVISYAVFCLKKKKSRSVAIAVHYIN